MSETPASLILAREAAEIVEAAMRHHPAVAWATAFPAVPVPSRPDMGDAVTIQIENQRGKMRTIDTTARRIRAAVAADALPDLISVWASMS